MQCPDTTMYALGDAALIPLNGNPQEDPADYATQTAQFAVREALSSRPMCLPS